MNGSSVACETAQACRSELSGQSERATRRGSPPRRARSGPGGASRPTASRSRHRRPRHPGGSAAERSAPAVLPAALRTASCHGLLSIQQSARRASHLCGGREVTAISPLTPRRSPPTTPRRRKGDGSMCCQGGRRSGPLRAARLPVRYEPRRRQRLQPHLWGLGGGCCCRLGSKCPACLADLGPVPAAPGREVSQNGSDPRACEGGRGSQVLRGDVGPRRARRLQPKLCTEVGDTFVLESVHRPTPGSISSS